MPTFYGAIDLTKNELRNAVMQNLGSAPSSPGKGQMYMNSADNNLYWYDGTAWVSARPAGALTPATSTTNSAVGDAAVTGISTNYSRQDHVHGREAFGASTAETAFGSAKADGVAATVARSDHGHGNPVHDAAAHAGVPISALATATAPINMGNFKITNQADPSAFTDGATKNYVDNQVGNVPNTLGSKSSVRVATTANITQSGTGATVDGVVLASGDRILCKDQTTQTQNGLFLVQAAAWNRTTDGSSLRGMTVYVEEGSANADSLWGLTTNGVINPGTTALQYAKLAPASGVTPASTVTTEAVGSAPVVGVSSNYAREDHIHGRESFGAITAEIAFGGASSNGSAATVARSDHAHGNPTHVAADHSTIPISSLAMASAPGINMNNQPISNLALIPNNVGDATSKQYVDNLVAGLSWKDSVRVATTANITLSGTQTIDGVSVIANDRVLVKNQTTASGNGLYLCQAGAWTRTTDADGTAEIPGMAVYVEEGTTQNGTAWTLTTDPPITLGVTNLAFAQFGGGTTYGAGAGLTLTGATFDVVAADTTLTVNPDSMQVNTGVIATVAALTAAVTGLAKKFAAALTGTASPEVVTHNLNTRDILLVVYNGSTPYTAVEVDWDATSVNTATIRYNPNLGAGYRVVVMG